MYVQQPVFELKLPASFTPAKRRRLPSNRC